MKNRARQQPRDGSRPYRAVLPALVLLASLTGCAMTGPRLDQALLADRGATERNQGVATAYRVGCPDVLEVTAQDRPELSGLYAVTADGRIDLGEVGQVRVEGLTLPEAARRVAGEAELPPARVWLRVAAYNSQKVYLFGAVNGQQRAVAYHGEETVLDLLHRVGGITPGAAFGEVRVLRPRLAEGQQPQTFHVDLRAIILDHDESSNVRVQPFDQVYVGESRKACFGKCVPPWLRPAYDSVCGMRHPGTGKEPPAP
jgi:protein involved in polysaccharide export with SLBB domain